MTVDNTKLQYYSNWDIDQMVASDIKTVGTGTTLIYTVPSNSVALPIFEMQFKPTGSFSWYGAGANSTDGTIGSLFTFYSYLQGTGIYSVTTSSGTVRYFIYSDKINY